MTREHKLSLLLGFAIVLVVGILISDHFSGASRAELESQDPAVAIDAPAATSPASNGSSLALVGRDGQDHTPPSDRTAQGAEDSLALVGDESTDQPDRLAQADENWFGDTLVPALRDLGFNQPAVQTSEQDSGVPTIDMSLGSRESQQRTALDLATMPEFTLYRVRSGDSLWSIAQQHLGDGSRHPEIAAINEDRLGKGGTLREGASLRIPVPGASTQSNLAPSEPGPDPVVQLSGKSSTYTVKKGDTLSEIAQELLGTIRRMDEILESNVGTLASANDLRIGMKLTIPAR